MASPHTSEVDIIMSRISDVERTMPLFRGALSHGPPSDIDASVVSKAFDEFLDVIGRVMNGSSNTSMNGSSNTSMNGSSNTSMNGSSNTSMNGNRETSMNDSSSTSMNDNNNTSKSSQALECTSSDLQKDTAMVLRGFTMEQGIREVGMCHVQVVDLRWRRPSLTPSSFSRIRVVENQTLTVDEVDPTLIPTTDLPIMDLTPPSRYPSTDEIKSIFENHLHQDNVSISGCFVGPSTLIKPRYDPILLTSPQQTKSIPSITSTSSYLHVSAASNKQTSIAMHISYCKWAMASLVVAGHAKIWLCVEPKDTLKLEEMIRKELRPDMAVCSQAVRHLNILLSPSLLAQWGISFGVEAINLGDNVTEETIFALDQEADYINCDETCDQSHTFSRKGKETALSKGFQLHGTKRRASLQITSSIPQAPRLTRSAIGTQVGVSDPLEQTTSTNNGQSRRQNGDRHPTASSQDLSTNVGQGQHAPALQHATTLQHATRIPALPHSESSQSQTRPVDTNPARISKDDRIAQLTDLLAATQALEAEKTERLVGVRGELVDARIMLLKERLLHQVYKRRVATHANTLLENGRLLEEINTKTEMFGVANRRTKELEVGVKRLTNTSLENEDIQSPGATGTEFQNEGSGTESQTEGIQSPGAAGTAGTESQNEGSGTESQTERIQSPGAAGTESQTEAIQNNPRNAPSFTIRTVDEANNIRSLIPNPHATDASLSQSFPTPALERIQRLLRRYSARHKPAYVGRCLWYQIDNRKDSVWSKEVGRNGSCRTCTYNSFLCCRIMEDGGGLVLPLAPGFRGAATVDEPGFWLQNQDDVKKDPKAWATGK